MVVQNDKITFLRKQLVSDCVDVLSLKQIPWLSLYTVRLRKKKGLVKENLNISKGYICTPLCGLVYFVVIKTVNTDFKKTLQI